MSDLVEFAKRIEQQLQAADRAPHWEPGEAEQYMAEVAQRREQFKHLASELKELVIQPRLETFAGFFSHAGVSNDEPAGRSSCVLGYCERFPASVKIEFAVEHDVRFEKATVCYDASMTPVFIKLDECDKLPLPLDAVDPAAVAAWVEERLIGFLDVYLRIDRGGEDFDADTVTDPVCGMRFSRSQATASDSYRGHPYFFCSQQCQQMFASEPRAYVDVKTM